MRLINIFYDTMHLEPSLSVDIYLRMIKGAQLKGLIYELITYDGIENDLDKFFNESISIEEFMSNLKNKFPNGENAECVKYVLKFCKDNKVRLLPFGGNGEEKVYYKNLKNIIKQGLEEGNYSIIIGGLHEKFFNKKIKPLLEKCFDKVIQSVSIDKWWIKN